MKGLSLTFAKLVIELRLRLCSFTSGLIGNNGDARGSAAAVVLEERGTISRSAFGKFSCKFGAFGASYPNGWFTNKRAKLSKDLL